MGIVIDREELITHLKAINSNYSDESINYELFVRTIAMLLELKNLEHVSN